MSTDELRVIDLLNRVPHGRVAASLRAMPFLALARHAVVEGRLLIRMHRGGGHHQALSGAVVAYAADNLTAGAVSATSAPGPEAPTSAPHPVRQDFGDLWSAQVIGTCHVVENGPGTVERELLGPLPHGVDGEEYDPVYLWLTPEFAEVHRLQAVSPAAARAGSLPEPVL